jgi:hypothetical protein
MRMHFNIFHLLIAATAGFSIGCATALRVSLFPFPLRKLQFGTFGASLVGFLATLVFCAREAEHRSPGVVYELLLSAVIATPFLLLCAGSIISPSRKYETSAFALAAVFATVGPGIYYYFFEIKQDEYGELLIFMVVAIEFFAALFYFGAVCMHRKQAHSNARLHQLEL